MIDARRRLLLCGWLCCLGGCALLGVRAQQAKLAAGRYLVPGADAVEQLSLGDRAALGEVASLDDGRFSRVRAADGLWRPFDFMLYGATGLYFLEPYNPRKTPVLFVHGVNGTPRDFRLLIEGLDGRLFQPWVYCYPSGLHLDTIAAHLDQTLRQLQGRYALHELLVVAHSVGGLISRSLILRQAGTVASPHIPLFISIASPWDGVDAARLGVAYAPEPVWVWYDLVPGDEFLTRLFYEGTTGSRRRLPPDTAHHLIVAIDFGEAGDGRVSVQSQLRREATEEAADMHAIDQSHAGVLREARTAALVNRLLAEALRPPLATREARLAAPGSPARLSKVREVPTYLKGNHQPPPPRVRFRTPWCIAARPSVHECAAGSVPQNWGPEGYSIAVR
jgi:pimeloyl-ACP methyl ester carboxylesterase